MSEIQFIDPPSKVDESLPAEPPGRMWIRPTELFMVIGALLIAVAIISIATQRSRESARLYQCEWQLKQIGLGIHNFHDAHNGIPPLAIGDGRASMFVLILPFTERLNTFELFDGKNEAKNTSLAGLVDGSSPNDPVSAWAVFKPHERRYAASTKWMLCPARRRVPQERPMSAAADSYAGPLGDYAVVFYDVDPEVEYPFRMGPPDVSAKNGWRLHQDPCDPAEVDRQKGAIRLARVPCEDENPYAKWKPRDTFARVTDGLSVTFFVGEKHVRGDELGRYSAAQDDQDGVYLFTSDTGGRNFNVARNLGFPLANGPNDPRFRRGQIPAKGPEADFGFGSWHSGVVPFLRGDGSVTPVNYQLDDQVRRKYAHAQSEFMW